MIKSWSHSRLGVFEQCKFRAKLAYIDRIPEPERPLPPGKTEHANDRGDRIHKAAESFVRNSAPLISELNNFSEELKVLQRLYGEGKVSLEEEWGFDQNWAACDYKTAWLRAKADVVVHLSKTEATVIDYKSGKKFGNEIKHGEQVQLYAMMLFLRHPTLETVNVELWYIDQNDTTVVRGVSRIQSMRHLKSWDRRGKAVTTSKAFPPNPNIFSCKYCPYKETPCTVAVAGNKAGENRMYAKKAILSKGK